MRTMGFRFTDGEARTFVYVPDPASVDAAVAYYDGQWSFPVFHNPPETAYGGDFGEEVHDGNFVADGFAAS